MDEKAIEKDFINLRLHDSVPLIIALKKVRAMLLRLASSNEPDPYHFSAADLAVNVLTLDRLIDDVEYIKSKQETTFV